MLTIDFETRSTINLSTCGTVRYALDPSTEVLCLAVKEDGNETKLWVPKEEYGFIGLPYLTSKCLIELVLKHKHIEAHSAQFEYAIWKHIMHFRLGFPSIHPERLYCSAAKCAVAGLPRGLKDVGLALENKEIKSDEGSKVMKKLCKPKTLVPLTWHEDPEDHKALQVYCVQDVETEHEISSKLSDISDEERNVYLLDRKINEKGMHIDKYAIELLIERIEAYEPRLKAEVKALTEGAIDSPTKVTALVRWLSLEGVEVDNMQATTVDRLLKTTLSKKVRRVLECRKAIAKSSNKKLFAMLSWEWESRIKGTLIYYGAATGRWSGQGPQTQNIPRTNYTEQDISNVIENSSETLALAYGDPIEIASNCIRGVICAPKGKELYCADYSSIEARILAWLSGHQVLLQAFEKNEDVYKIAASGMYNKKIESIDSEDRLAGKVATLALGYQGWIGALSQMAENYRLDLSEEKKLDICKKWRESNKEIVEYWYRASYCAIQACSTDKAFECKGALFYKEGAFLKCKLSSGRLLSYYKPEVANEKGKLCVNAFGVNSKTDKYERLSLYPGRLVNNIIQATARDLLAHSMINVDQKGFTIVSHTHDEIVVEEEAKTDRYEEFLEVFKIKPSWADGLSLDASGWRGRRYRK